MKILAGEWKKKAKFRGVRRGKGGLAEEGVRRRGGPAEGGSSGGGFGPAEGGSGGGGVRWRGEAGRGEEQKVEHTKKC